MLPFPREQFCVECGMQRVPRRKVFKGKKNGRKPKYCSAACRTRAWRRRVSTAKAHFA